MRLPYISPQDAKSSTSPEEASRITRIESRRSPRPLQPLDLTLLHNPLLADGFSHFAGAIRSQTSLSADVREIAIARVGVLNGAFYEWAAHAPLCREAGVGEKGVEVLKRRDFDWEGRGKEERKTLTEKQWVVVRFTDEMTRVGEGAWEEVRRHFGDREIVELTATIAWYNCVSRFLVALDVGEKNDTEIS